MPEVNDDTARYSLYWTWASAGMSCHAMLEELGVDYDLRYIEFEEPWPEDYLAINPHHKVPTLIDHKPGGSQGEPVIIYQSAAILLYLAENHPEAQLIPPLGHADRAASYQWLFFMAETLHANFLAYFYPHRHTMDETGQAAVQQKAAQRIDEFWGSLDTQIGASPFILGDQISVCDFYLLPLVRWNNSDNDFRSLERHSNVANTVLELNKRPAVAHMLARHLE
jgi:glutathione S-transferase